MKVRFYLLGPKIAFENEVVPPIFNKLEGMIEVWSMNSESKTTKRSSGGGCQIDFWA